MSDAGNAADQPWFAALDDEGKGFIQNRGLDKKTAPEAALDLLKSFRETQAKLGIPADRVVRWPADDADEAGWKNVRAKLGVPETPEGYDFSTVKYTDGSDPDAAFVAFMRDTAARLHIPKDTAAQFAAALVKHGEQNKADEANRAGSALGAAKVELAQSWGQNMQANEVIANRTAGLLGFDPEFIAALPPARYVPFMQKMLEAGSRMGEATLIGNGQTPSGTRPVVTREGAVARIAELNNDPAWYARFKNPMDPGHKAAVDEWNHLNQIQASRAA
jgi:hypothetical protein